jgi:hypothetical protein
VTPAFFSAVNPIFVYSVFLAQFAGRHLARTVAALAVFSSVLWLPTARAQGEVGDSSRNAGAGGGVAFAQGANGDVLPDMVLAGPGTGLLLPIAVVANTTHLYALFNDFVEPPFVLKFSLPTTNNASPVSKTYLAPSADAFSFFTAVAVDCTHLYVLDNGTGGVALGAVEVYPLASLTGNSSGSPLAATRTVTGNSTLLNRPSGLAVDGTAIYVANRLGNNVLIFDLAATDNAAPIRQIAGTSTALNGPACIAVDATKISVLNALSSRVTTYALGASGNVAPATTVGSSSLTSGAFFVAVDATRLYIGGVRRGQIGNQGGEPAGDRTGSHRESRPRARVPRLSLGW